MKNVLVILASMVLATSAFATPNQDHTCQGGHNCNTTEGGGSMEQGQGQLQGQLQLQGQQQGQIAEGGDALAFGGQGGDSESNSGVFGSGNSDVDVKNTVNTNDFNTNVVDVDAYGVKGDVEGGDAFASNLNVVEGDKNTNIQGQDVDVANDNASNATTGDQITNVTVGGEGQPLTASSQNVEGSSLTVEDNTQTTYRNRSVALALPGATADNGSTASCLESRRGWMFAGFGASGRTRDNESCVEDRSDRREFEQCYTLADAYAKLGLIDHAVAQLQDCGAIVIEGAVFGEEYIQKTTVTTTEEVVPALPVETRIGG